MLAVGTTLGPYKILAPLGAGAMGEVYRARDSRLNRDVAPGSTGTPDGQRVLITMPIGEAPASSYAIMLNWTAALRR